MAVRSASSTTSRGKARSSDISLKAMSNSLLISFAQNSRTSGEVHFLILRRKVGVAHFSVNVYQFITNSAG
jgi:hypothetical protein